MKKLSMFLAAGILVCSMQARAENLAVPSGCTYEGKAVSGTTDDPDAFESMTQKRVGLLNTFVGRYWSSLSGQTMDDKFTAISTLQKAKPCVRIVISYPGLPKENATREQCAAGEYDQYYQAFATKLKVNKIKGAIMRVGWEWDIKTNPNMSVLRDISKAPAFAACFRRIVTVMRGAYPDGKMVFDYNSSGSVTPELLAAGYPGDQYTDIVSIEGYDNRPCLDVTKKPDDTECRWARVEAANNMVRDFAKSHNKVMAFPEWGIWNDGGVIGNENLLHIRRMCKYAKNPANNVAYYAYFQSDNYPVSSLKLNPAALSTFVHECGINGTAQ